MKKKKKRKMKIRKEKLRCKGKGKSQLRKEKESEQITKYKKYQKKGNKEKDLKERQKKIVEKREK